jgi:hypothetical protein
LHVLARARTAVSVGYEECGVGPDFRFYEPDGQYMGAIEAVSLAMRHDWEQKAAEHNHLVVGLNERLKLTRYYVGFEIVRADQAISVNKAAAFVSAVMESLPKTSRPSEIFLLWYTATRVSKSSSPLWLAPIEQSQGRAPPSSLSGPRLDA